MSIVKNMVLALTRRLNAARQWCMSIAKGTILALMGAGAGYALIFGAGGGGKGPPAGAVVVQYWEKWNGNEAAQMQVIVKDFNDTVGKEKNIYVEYMSMSEVDHKTLIATAAGTPPDVAGLWGDQTAQFASVHALEPLDEMAAGYGIREGYYKKVYWDALHYDGKLYALISSPAVACLHYNRRIFAENAANFAAYNASHPGAHLDATRAPRTIAELSAYAEVLDHRGADGKLTCAGFLPLEPNWFTNDDVYWFGGDIYDEKQRKILMTSGPSIAAGKWIESFSKRLGADALAEFHAGMGDFNTTQNGFLTGGVAMEQQGPWMANYIRDLKPEMTDPAWKGMNYHGLSEKDKKAVMDAYMALPLDGATEGHPSRRSLAEWAVAPFPGVDEAGANPDTAYAFCGFDTLVIPSTAKHKKEAFAFIAYVNRLEVMEKLCSMHCKNTPLTKTSEGWLKNHPNPYIEIFDRCANSPHAKSYPTCPVWPELNAEMTDAIEEIALLKARPEEALTVVQNRMQPRLDTFFARQAERAAEGK